MIPCLTLSLINPSCFDRAILGARSIDMNYKYTICTDFDENYECTFNFTRISTVQFNPPFIYYHRCSSAFITQYASIQVYRSSVTLLVSFMIMLVAVKQTERTHNFDSRLWYIISKASIVYLRRNYSNDVEPEKDFIIKFKTITKELFVQFGNFLFKTIVVLIFNQY